MANISHFFQKSTQKSLTTSSGYANLALALLIFNGVFFFLHHFRLHGEM